MLAPSYTQRALEGNPPMRYHNVLIATIGLGLVLACSAATDPSGTSDGATDAAGGGDATAVDREVVATVNGRPLHHAFYIQNLNFIRDRIQATRGEGSVEGYVGAKFEALENLIKDELIYQEAQRQGVGVNDEEVEAEYASIASRQGGEEAFLARMRVEQMDKDLVLQGIRRRMTNNAFIGQKVTVDLDASDAEIEAYFDANKNAFASELWLNVSHILIRCNLNAGFIEAEEARERAEKILANIRGGRSFQLMAREFSEDPSSALDGELGYIKRGTTHPEFEAAAFKLGVGDVSDVIRTDAGFHIIKVNGRRGGTVRDFEEVRELCRQGVLRGKSVAAVEDLIEGLRKSAEIETYLK